MSYYNFMHSIQDCRDCHWSGPGSDATIGEWFREGAEYHCPECDHYFGFVMFPTTAEMKTDPRASRGDRTQAVLVEERWQHVSKSRLQSVDPLPDLDPGPGILTWDVIDGEDAEEWISISDGEVEVWRELSCFEEYERFGELAKLLQAKYRGTLRDVIPTDASWFNLGGDCIGSIGYVEGVRKSLRAKSRTRIFFRVSRRIKLASKQLWGRIRWN